MTRLRAWYAVPLAVLIVGIGLAGTALWRIINRPAAPAVNSTQATNQSDDSLLDSCGDGICQNAACLSTNCPPPETPDSCPDDCTVDEAGQAGTDSADQPVANTNEPADTVTALDFKLDEQSLEHKRTCPLEDSNLTPADAVAVAQEAGLEQGTGAVTVSLYQFGPPLEQCVWNVKNFTTTAGGRSVVIIDATQEVYQQSAWGSGA
jgi:hypothetical protein